MGTDEIFLKPGFFVDSDQEDIIEFAHETVQGLSTNHEKALALYYRVRDGILYNPYVTDFEPETLKASTALREQKSFCVPKAALLAASARALGIRARLGFANVKNHLMSKRLADALQSKTVAFHGYTDEKWVKATPAFHARMCKLFRVKPLEFDGYHDSIFHENSGRGERFMEYLVDHGSFADIPYEQMIDEYKKVYPHWFSNGKLVLHEQLNH